MFRGKNAAWNGGVVLVLLFALALIVVPMPPPQSPPQQSTEQSGNSSTFHSNDIPGGPSVNSKTGDLSEEQLDSCFLSGESAATAYISDMAKYANSGLMPSTVMEKGCERKGNETANPKACIDSCEMGFRKVAKDVLNGR